jgi:hypothetical protein
VPTDYLEKMASYYSLNSDVGAISGIVLQLEKGKWTGEYPVNSSLRLIWNFIFQLSLWGEIHSKGNNWMISAIKKYYAKKGNHISKAGWPVLTDFSGGFFKTAIYGLGASLVKRQWLLNSPFDEVLDANGIGDNYGVAVGFPSEIHVLTNIFVYHHRELSNRISEFNSAGKRILALHYFIKTRSALIKIKPVWLLWSLFGMLFSALLEGDFRKSRIIFICTFRIIFQRNPYLNRANLQRGNV